ncbi:MAG TPA: GlmU family protein [Ohtaekwangia sp.]|nr:GlmU family protein [Ohtaekwangia sp.]
MNVILFDDPVIRQDLLPFTFTRPVAGIRVGIMTLAEKWEHWLGFRPSYKTEDYLQPKFPARSTSDNFLINGAICPDQALVEAIKALPGGYFLVKNDLLIAVRQPEGAMDTFNTIAYPGELTVIDKTWKIFTENDAQLRVDFTRITAGKTSRQIDDKHTVVYGTYGENIFVEEGVYVRAAILNAENGPIYLGKNSIVQEGAIIRGPFAMGEGSHINMGAKIRGNVSIGPYSKVGGEVSTSVIFGYSNKAHDGFLGCSVLGEWCNLGADTNTSNLKNNYDSVKLWSHRQEEFIDTGLQFCGLMMGDHSKCGINTMFNTGTVVDVSANLFGSGFPRNYIPSFTWGGPAGYATYLLEKALVTSERCMARRNVTPDRHDEDILAHVYQMTMRDRAWEDVNEKTEH